MSSSAGDYTIAQFVHGIPIDSFHGRSGMVYLGAIPTADDSAEIAYPGDGVYVILLESIDQIFFLNMGESGSVSAISDADGTGAQSAWKDGDAVNLKQGGLAVPKIIGRMSSALTKVWLRRVNA